MVKQFGFYKLYKQRKKQKQMSILLKNNYIFFNKITKNKRIKFDFTRYNNEN